uniref:Uncharacterized protein n=1 Tax=Trichinella nativa TaxID=6335 RepID=A0A0V1KHG6_9BILA
METRTIVLGIWQETVKNVKNEKLTWTWNVARKLTNKENEKIAW